MENNNGMGKITMPWLTPRKLRGLATLVRDQMLTYCFSGISKSWGYLQEKSIHEMKSLFVELHLKPSNLLK